MSSSEIPPAGNPLAPEIEACGTVCGVLQTSVCCAGCGYNLRGLPVDGHCPECATPVGRSLRGDLLQFSDPRWVDRLAGGMNWIVASIVIGILGGIGLIPLFVTLGSAGHPLFEKVYALVTGTVTLVGYWLVTTPEPRRALTEPLHSARSVLRILAILVFGLDLMEGGVTHLLPPAGRFAAWVVMAVSYAEIAAGFIYARQLALRVPDERLARRTRIVMWGTMTCLVSLALAVLLDNLTGGIGLLPCLILPGAAVFGVWSLVLVLRYRKALRNEAENARRAWAAAET